MTQVYDVIVLGCGAAGVAALSQLSEEGVGLKVLGLEGNDKLGGRVCTTPFAGGFIELGAQYCNESTDNVVYSLVKDLDILDHPTERKKNIFSNGQLLDESVTDKYRRLLISIMNEARKAKVKNTEPLVDFIKNRYYKQLDEADFTVDREIATEMYDWFVKSTLAKISNNELMEKSVNSLKESWDNVGERWYAWKDKGYNTIIDILLKKYPDPSEKLPVEILLNKEVVNIKWGQQNPNGENLVHLMCRDGTRYITRHAIVTFSIGVLKEKYETLFSPSLPDAKIMSIRSLAMCTMNKIYIHFPTTWWPNSFTHYGFLWKPEDKAQYTCNFEDVWLTEVYALTTVEKQPNVLCAYVAGTAAEDMELNSTHEIQDKIYKLIKKFLGDAYTIPEPSEVIRSTWYSNPLARGAYSYRSIETEYVNCGATVLGEPLLSGDNIPVVCFAGEATSIHHHSTVHGAVESGFREAKRLISVLKS